jgi:AraC-like DNA-binding protein
LSGTPAVGPRAARPSGCPNAGGARRGRTSFAELLDDSRRELAAGYLQRTDYSVAEAAYLVGFAEVSSFNRAFRRWTGRSPSAARRGLESGRPRVRNAKGAAN